MADAEHPTGTGPLPGPPPPAQEKVLRRSREDRVIAGVAGGLGRYFGVDPVLVRVAFVLVAILGGSGVLAYLILWLVMPEERGGERLGPAPRSTALSGTVLIGLILIAVGVMSLVALVIPGEFVAKFLVPAVLIVVGIAVIVMGATRDR